LDSVLRRGYRSSTCRGSIVTTLHVLVPAYHQSIHTTFASSLIRLVADRLQAGEPTLYTFWSESLISRARNELLASFLDGPGDVLAFIDADVGFEPKDIRAMVQSNLDVVGGAVPLKFDDRALFSFAPSDAPPAIPANGGKYIRAREIGCGVLLIRRHVVVSMVDRFRKLAYTNDNGLPRVDLFGPTLEPNGSTQRLLSEDFAFCKRARDCGYKLHVAVDAKFTHAGQKTWHGDYAAGKVT
jgi:hypothetical protein